MTVGGLLQGPAGQALTRVPGGATGIPLVTASWSAHSPGLTVSWCTCWPGLPFLTEEVSVASAQAWLDGSHWPCQKCLVDWALLGGRRRQTWEEVSGRNQSAGRLASSFLPPGSPHSPDPFSTLICSMASSVTSTPYCPSQLPRLPWGAAKYTTPKYTSLVHWFFFSIDYFKLITKKKNSMYDKIHYKLKIKKKKEQQTWEKL